MPTTTSYEFGDVVLIPFVFTDQTTTKRRPAVVVSSDAYHRERPDMIAMALTSLTRPPFGTGEAAIVGWKQAGLLRPTVLKPLLATVERKLVVRTLGRLQRRDLDAVTASLSVVLGRR
jgi:mRNA-degrading endonuclease toxin of MazEF toxin-antitoxin module